MLVDEFFLPSRPLDTTRCSRSRQVDAVEVFAHWLTAEQGKCALASTRSSTTERKTRPSLLALLLACGLRRHEAVALTLDHLQQREEHWAIVDLVGKGGHVRTVPVPDWVRTELDDWLAAAAIDRGRMFRRV